MSTIASSDNVDALLRRCTFIECKVDSLKSNQGSNETGVMGEAEAREGGSKAHVIADLVESYSDQLKREKKNWKLEKIDLFCTILPN